jgi:hypothetical protein
MAELDFELEIRESGEGYELSVLNSPAGEASQTVPFPFDPTELKLRLQALEIALLRSSGTRRRLPTAEEKQVQDFGQQLFDWLIQGDVRSLFDSSRNSAKREGKPLRVKLRFDSPALAALPWEFLYDSRRAEFVVLSTSTPLVRYLELPDPIEPLSVTGPLRVLGLVASPSDLPRLDSERERHRVEEATKSLQERGLLEVEWLPTGTWRELQAALRRGKWHIFHYVGHGGFDPATDEGMLALVDENGGTFRLRATELGRLLGDHQPLRLAVLNACEGAKGSDHNLFSSTAATVLRRGTPAVVAMQYEITDEAAIEFSRAFYEAIADGVPVDIGIAEARKAVSLAIGNTLEWGTPVLFMRAPDGVLFRVRKGSRRPRATTATIAAGDTPGQLPFWQQWSRRTRIAAAGAAATGALALAALGAFALVPRGGVVPTPTPAPTQPLVREPIPAAIRSVCTPFGFSEPSVYGYVTALRCPLEEDGIEFVKYATYPDVLSLRDQWTRRMRVLGGRLDNGGCWNGRAGETAWERGRVECNMSGSRVEVRWTDESSRIYGTVLTLSGGSLRLPETVEWWSSTAVSGGAQP